MTRWNKVTGSIVSLGAMLFLWACENDIQEVNDLANDEIIPMEVQEDLYLTYSDSSTVKMELKASLAENYPHLEEPKLEFPEGIKVKFFDGRGEEDSRLRANHAIQYVNKRLWEATGNVVVLNKKGERLDTEKLFWNERDKKIYSDDFVKITTPEEIIMGEGFEADQNFTNYTISKVTGQILVDDEESDQNN